MENIIEPSDKFDFSKLNLENPIPLQGGNFFTKLNFTEKQLPLLVQLPKCSSKHGLIQTQSNKKTYIDLLFNYFETDVLTWFENLEIKCRELIFSKKDLWFQTEMDLDDIENMFISPAKSYKSGKFISVRAHIPSTKHIKKDYCLIYDENERILETTAINENTTVISLINIEGIKFSSKSFQLEINLRQVMVLSIENDIQNGCLIKRNMEALDKNEEKNLLGSLETTTIVDNSNNLQEQLEEQNEEITNINLEDNTVQESLPMEKPEDLVEDKSEEQLKELSNETSKEENNISEEKNEQEDINTTNTLPSNLKDREQEDLLEVHNLLEVELSTENINDEVSLKKPNDVYLEIYKTAREKAKHMKQATIEAYLEARNIKTKYMLDEINPSDDESINLSEFEE